MANRNEQLAQQRALSVSGFELYIDEPGIELQVYKMDAAGKILAKCFMGKAGKPAWFYSFKTVEKLDAYIAEQIKGRQASLDIKAKWKAERNAPVAFEVGQIFRSSWGYDQTNIDYYEITKVIGKVTAEVRKIAGGGMDVGCWGQSDPQPGQYVGEPMVKRVGGYCGQPIITIASYASAYLYTPKAKQAA